MQIQRLVQVLLRLRYVRAQIISLTGGSSGGSGGDILIRGQGQVVTVHSDQSPTISSAATTSMSGSCDLVVMDFEIVVALQHHQHLFPVIAPPNAGSLSGSKQFSDRC